MHRSIIQTARIAPAIITVAIASWGLLAPTQAAAAAKPLKCQASVSDARPSDDSTTSVLVQTTARARVSTSAMYKTTTDTQSATANSKGLAVTSYDVSDATPGFRVQVTVLVQKGRRSGQCLTSYVPQ
jgi:hypothetical protein